MVWLALAALGYLLVPGVYAAHTAVAHADHGVTTPGADAGADHHEQGDDHREHGGHDHERHDHGPTESEPHCTLCQLMGTLGHAVPVPAPTALVAIDVTSPEYVFTPVEPRLPTDPAATPASPRAPPAFA